VNGTVSSSVRWT